MERGSGILMMVVHADLRSRVDDVVITSLYDRIRVNNLFSIYPQVMDLEPAGPHHHGHQVLAGVVQVVLGSAQDYGGGVLPSWPAAMALAATSNIPASWFYCQSGSPLDFLPSINCRQINI